MSEEITSTAAYKAAELYEQFIVANIFRYWTPLLLDRLDPQPGEQVLDAACGTGVVARTVVPMVKPDGEVVGMDINPAMLEVACRQFSSYCDEVDWREGQAERMPFPEQSFDLVLCQQGLQFFQDRAAAAREMRRVLREGGRVGIAVWQRLESHPFYHTYFHTVAEVFDIPVAGITQPWAFGNPQALADLLEAAGFRHVEVEEVCQDAFFTEPEHFAERMVRGASAAVPGLDPADLASQSEMFAEVKDRMAGLIKEYTYDGILTVPLYANIATAYR